MSQQLYAIVPAAGTGSRMSGLSGVAADLPKQYLPINGIPMIVHTLTSLLDVARVRRVLVVLAPNDQYWETHAEPHLRAQPNAGKLERRYVGGAARADSVAAGLQSLSQEADAQDWVLVHDAARPCLTTRQVDAMIDALITDTVGGILALPVADTVKRASETERIEATVPRDRLWRAQTPQMFRYGLLSEAIARFPAGTDEAQSIEAMGLQPKLVVGDAANIKVTYPTDLRLAALLLQAQSGTHLPPG